MLTMNFLSAYLFGLTMAFTVGPMTLLIVQRGIHRGLRSSLSTASAIAGADFTFAICTFGIGRSILQFMHVYETYVHVFSGMVLLALAMHVLYSSCQTYAQHQKIVAAKGVGGDFVSAYLLTMHNPMTIAIFLGFIGYLTDATSPASVIGFAFALFLGSLSGQVAFAVTASSLRGIFQNQTSIFTLNVISATGIAVFAIMSFLKVL